MKQKFIYEYSTLKIGHSLELHERLILQMRIDRNTRTEEISLNKVIITYLFKKTSLMNEEIKRLPWYPWSLTIRKYKKWNQLWHENISSIKIRSMFFSLSAEITSFFDLDHFSLSFSFFTSFCTYLGQYYRSFRTKLNETSGN